jgi:hypothetical protein
MDMSCTAGARVSRDSLAVEQKRSFRHYLCEFAVLVSLYCILAVLFGTLFSVNSTRTELLHISICYREAWKCTSVFATKGLAQSHTGETDALVISLGNMYKTPGVSGADRGETTCYTSTPILSAICNTVYKQISAKKKITLRRSGEDIKRQMPLFVNLNPDEDIELIDVESL